MDNSGFNYQQVANFENKIMINGILHVSKVRTLPKKLSKNSSNYLIRK